MKKNKILTVEKDGKNKRMTKAAFNAYWEQQGWTIVENVDATSLSIKSVSEATKAEEKFLEPTSSVKVIKVIKNEAETTDIEEAKQSIDAILDHSLTEGEAVENLVANNNKEELIELADLLGADTSGNKSQLAHSIIKKVNTL